MVSRPPAGIASRALTARLTSICSTDAGSTVTGRRSGASAVTSSTSSLISRRSSFSSCCTSVLMSTTCGCSICRRLNASSCRVSAAARSPGRLNLQQIRAQRILLRDLVEHQVAVAENRGQQVVEVVRDAAGELADRLHLLRLAQLLFEPAPLGDVARVDDDAADRRIVEAVDADAFHDSPRAVRVMEPHLCDDRRARVAERLDQPRRRPARDRRGAGSRRSSGRPSARRPAQMTLRRGAEVGDAAFGVDQQQRVGAVLDQRAKALFAGAQRRLGLPALPLFGVQRQRMANRPFERLDRQVDLAEIVGGAGLHRLDGHFLGAAAGQHDDRRVDAALPDLAQQGSGRRGSRASSRRTRRRTAAPSARRAPRRTRPRCGSSASGQASPARMNSSTIRACSGASSTTRRRSGSAIVSVLNYFRRKMPAILPPRPRKNPSIARDARCLSEPRWIGQSADGTVSPSLKILRVDRAAIDRRAGTTRCTAPRRECPAAPRSPTPAAAAPSAS